MVVSTSAHSGLSFTCHTSAATSDGDSIGNDAVGALECPPNTRPLSAACTSACPRRNPRLPHALSVEKSRRKPRESNVKFAELSATCRSASLVYVNWRVSATKTSGGRENNDE